METLSPSGSPTDRRRASAVAATAIRLAERRGICLPDDLLIWRLAGPPSSDGDRSVEPGEERLAGDLAGVLETVTSADERQVNGLHVTPRWLADDLVSRALDDFPGPDDPPAPGSGPAAAKLSICDPACGGGAFLLAAARSLHARGVSRQEVVERCLWGADIDAVGLATAEAALAVWAGTRPPPGRLVVGDALSDGRALWVEQPERGFDAVVGNPPFLSQLATATVRSEAAREAMRRRFGPAVRAYTDTAWLFLLAASELLRPGGRLALVQPASIVAARDASAVREELDRRAELRELWVEQEQVFAASVRVCCPVLETRRPSPAGKRSGGTRRARRSRWADQLADAIGVPRIEMTGSTVLGDRADVGAGFRGEYYGLVPLVREAAPGEAVAGSGISEPAAGNAGSTRPLVTVGVLDWGRSAWGERPVRFARRRWQRPVVDLTRAPESPRSTTPEGKAAAWLARTEAPKVVVANQTRVVEPVADPAGSWVPSVPALAVMPHDPEEVWRLAAAIGSPAASAWLLRRAPGTALARHAMKVAAGDLAALPLPTNGAAWDAAAKAFRAFAESGDGSEAVGDGHLDTYCREIAAAYGLLGDEVEAWWRDRREPWGHRDGEGPAPGAD